MTSPSARFRQRLLDCFLGLSPDLGWSENAMRRAAAEALLSEGETLLAAPNGVIDLIDAFADRADQEARAGLAATDMRGMKIREKVTLGVRLRIEALGPHKEWVRRAAWTLARPHHALIAARIGWRTADVIWTALGDQSTDENYYTKRLILAGVHGATLARWLSERDPDDEAVWVFLAERIENVMQFEKFKARLKPIAAAGPAVAGALARWRYGVGP